MNGRFSIDRRIASFTSIDGNLDAVANIGDMPGSKQTIGQFLSNNTRMSVGQGRDVDTALTVDSPKDGIDHRKIPGIDRVEPDYPAGSEPKPYNEIFGQRFEKIPWNYQREYHGFTGRNVAPITETFLRRVWD